MGFLSFSSGFQGNSNVSNYIVAVSHELILPFGFIFLFLLSFRFFRVLLGWKLVCVTFIIKPNHLLSLCGSSYWYLLNRLLFNHFFLLYMYDVHIVRAVNWLMKESTRKMLSFSIKLAFIKLAHTSTILGWLYAKWALQFICKKKSCNLCYRSCYFFAPKNSHKRDNQQ